MKLTGYETYCTYLALKNHFTKPSYDFIKYNGKVHVSKESFLARRDRFQFEKFARRHEDPKTFMLANFLQDRTWIGEFLDDEAADTFMQYVKTVQSMSYTFANDLDKLEDIRDYFKTKDNEYPLIVTLLMNGQMTIQSFVLLDHFIQFSTKFDAKMPDDYIWSKISFKAKKYKPFMFQDLDQKKFKDILKRRLTAHIYT